MDLGITPINVKQNPNFKQVTCVQIPKKAFINPENVRECSDMFPKRLDATVGVNRSVLSGMTNQIKTAYIPESMSYFAAKIAMQERGFNYSIGWAAQNTGLSIKKPINENYYSFYVFTKEHLDILKNAMLKAMNIKNYINEGKSKYPNDNDMAVIYATTKCGVETDKILDSQNAYNPTETIKLNSLDELDSVKDKLGI